MQLAMIRMQTPAARQARGLKPPTLAANTDGRPKMLAPMMELSIEAVRLQRPIFRSGACELCVTR
jgi:hypothetical protein